MSVIEELIRSEENGAISFGNHRLEKKAKLDNFEHQGDLYKVKTFHEITKLERNGMFVYESVPGTAVSCFKAADRSSEEYSGGASSMGGAGGGGGSCSARPMETRSFCAAWSRSGDQGSP